VTRRAPLLLVASSAFLATSVGIVACGRDGPASPPEPTATYAGDGSPLRPVPALRDPPNLVLVVIDTLRADSVLPRSGATSMPFVARLADQGVAFTQASSNAPWTMPALGSLVTGLLPSRHGSIDFRKSPALPRPVVTFAEILRESYGYETAAIVDTVWLGGPTAFGQGFSEYRMPFTFAGAEEQLAPWIAGRDRERPFFLYLHSNEVHDPYGPSNHPWPFVEEPAATMPPPDALDEPWEKARAFLLDRPVRVRLTRTDGDRFYDDVIAYMTTGYAASPRPALARELRERYDEGVRWVDAGIERLHALLSREGLLRDTLFVVTSDHGEAFGEHGLLGHGRQTYDEILRIPLVVSGPAPFSGGRRLHASVGLMDLLPTFLDHAGMVLPEGIDGRSMMPLLAAPDGAPGDGWPVIAQELRSPANTRAPGEQVLASVRTARWKYHLVRDLATGTEREEVYDLVADPDERDPLPASTLRSAAPPELCAAVERARALARDGSPPPPGATACR
jgi:arylsulfatase A-like enzyme